MRSLILRICTGSCSVVSLILWDKIYRGQQSGRCFPALNVIIESGKQFSWKRYFTALLVEETNETYLKYTKKKIKSSIFARGDEGQDLQANRIGKWIPDQFVRRAKGKMSQEVRKNPEKTLKKPSPTCHDALVASGLMYKRKIDAILAAGRESRASEPQKNPKIDVNTYSKKG